MVVKDKLRNKYWFNLNSTFGYVVKTKHLIVIVNLGTICIRSNFGFSSNILLQISISNKIGFYETAQKYEQYVNYQNFDK